MTFNPTGAFPVDALPDGDLRTIGRFSWSGTKGDTVDVPAGTITDGATVPWLVRAIVTTWGRIGRAALVHDVLCYLLAAYWRALTAWKRQEEINDDAARGGRGVITPQGPAPKPPAFSAVDADHAFRLILIELGCPVPLAWIYWEGVRVGALASAYRRDRWMSTFPMFALLLLPSLLVLLPTAVGSLVSKLLLMAVEAVCWPWTHRKPSPLLRRRAALILPPSPVPVVYATGGLVGARRVRFDGNYITDQP